MSRIPTIHSRHPVTKSPGRATRFGTPIRVPMGQSARSTTRDYRCSFHTHHPPHSGDKKSGRTTRFGTPIRVPMGQSARTANTDSRGSFHTHLPPHFSDKKSRVYHTIRHSDSCAGRATTTDIPAKATGAPFVPITHPTSKGAPKATRHSRHPVSSTHSNTAGTVIGWHRSRRPSKHTNARTSQSRGTPEFQRNFHCPFLIPN